METWIVAVPAIAIGLVVAVFGTRLFYFLLPLWGFLTGFAIGADLIANVAGSGFLATLASWIAGGVFGLLLGVLAALWYYGAILILGAGLGAAVASGLLAAIGIDSGLITLLAGVAAGVAVGALVIVADVPTLLVAAISGYAGAVWATAGTMLLLGRIHLEDLHAVGAAGAMRGDPLTVAIAFGAGTLAFLFQVLDLRARQIDGLRRVGYRF